MELQQDQGKIYGDSTEKSETLIAREQTECTHLGSFSILDNVWVTAQTKFNLQEVKKAMKLNLKKKMRQIS